MHFERSIHIAAPVEAIWAVLSDVERWPEWTPSMTEVRRLDDGPFAVGSRALVVQPRLRPATLRVTEFDPPRSFTWDSATPGVRFSGVHRIEVVPGGGRVTLGADFTGPLAWVVRLFYGGLVVRYVTTEAEILKRRVEGGRAG